MFVPVCRSVADSLSYLLIPVASISLSSPTMVPPPPPSSPNPDGDGSPLRISSVIRIDSVPPLPSSSPLLRAMTISPVKAHLKDSLASTIHTSVQGFVSPLRNTETTKLAVLFPLADQHISDSINLAEYGVYKSFNSGILCLCMLPSTHTNTTKHRHEVLTSLLSNFTNRKDKWYWILQFILAYYTGVIVVPWPVR
ncbi:hypothetical protein DVH24_003954 [Malus domestica]|uniref:Uncharacterized protein n=1 Tax=Malus domestica TaxID=3750 RepID=A0A498KCU5_MALDO|nr:hypothetical protein DVH24_003954 [Malus domestica]